MKKLVIILAFSLLFNNRHAQTENSGNDYNKWSIELAGGFNKPQRPMSDN
jgi:OOP family OmpA-OmpF porin